MKDLLRLSIIDWYNVGLQLDLDEVALERIDQSYPDFNIAMRKMFTLWLHSDERPSYHTLARALYLAKERRTAADICTKYGKNLRVAISLQFYIWQCTYV